MSIAIRSAKNAIPDAKTELAKGSFVNFLSKIAFPVEQRAARGTGRAFSGLVPAPGRKKPFVPHQHDTANRPIVRPWRTERNPYMPTSPKTIEEKIDRMLNAWRTLAPDKTFGGMTLAQFEAIASKSLDARKDIDNLNNQLAEATAGRDSADEVSLGKAKLVVNGVLADPDFGPDSALYGEFGYTRQSERKSGLTRGYKEAPTK